MRAIPACPHTDLPTVTFRYRDDRDQPRQWTGCKPCSHLAKGAVPARPTREDDTRIPEIAVHSIRQSEVSGQTFVTWHDHQGRQWTTYDDGWTPGMTNRPFALLSL